MMNQFLHANRMDPQLSGVRTENGAISYGTFGSELMNQFGKAGGYRHRPMSTVWTEQAALWSENQHMALLFPFYLRLITRQPQLADTDKVQRGPGNRDESFKRFLWLEKYHPYEFYKNLWLIPLFGSWKDLWELMVMAEECNDKMDYEKFFSVISDGLSCDSTSELVKKYLPQIRSSKKCNTTRAKRLNTLAKSFIKFLGLTPKEYRRIKTSGKAHKFQTIICEKKYDMLDWNKIPGKALLNLVNGQFLDRHNLVDSYIDWVEKQGSIKFNGYVYELARKLNYHSPRATVMTVNKQFDKLIETGKKDGGAIQGNVLCALDTSGSMSSTIDKSGLTCYDVCVGLGIYFSELNEGAFHNVVAMFDDVSRLMTLKGEFSDKLSQIRNARVAWGSTNFQSLIDLIINTRVTHPKIPIQDYPKTLLVVSDMQFNPVGTKESNYQAAIRKLRQHFPESFVKDFKIIWWYCCNRYTADFPSNCDCGGTYMISGFDGATVSFILGGEQNEKENRAPKTMEEVIKEAFSQDIFKLIEF